MKKFPYQRGSKQNISKDVVQIPLEVGVLKVPKENILLKALETEAYLWRVAKDEEEALQIAELLVISSKPL